MKKMIISIIVLLVVIIIGCKDGSAPAQTGAQAGQGAPNTNAQTASGQKPGSATSEFTGLLSKKANLEWKITYNVDTQVQGQSMMSTLTQYVKGTNKYRVDTKTSGIETRGYFLNNAFTTCSSMQGGWSCYKIDVPKDQVQDAEKDIQSNPAKYNVVADGTKAIAGVSTKCYKVASQVQGTSVNLRYCYTNDGLPLYTLMEASGAKTEMTATSFSRTVSDSDFELPAGASTQTMPTGPSGGSNPCDYCSYLSGTDKDECLASC